MIKTLRETKAKLSELVDLASRGQDVLITVSGQVKARLTRAVALSVQSDRTVWLRELRHLRSLQKRAPRQPTVEEMLAQLREDWS
jgi:prevent-host-death family protein